MYSLLKYTHRLKVKLADKHVIVDITEKDFEKSMMKIGDAVTLYFPSEDFLVFEG